MNKTFYTKNICTNYYTSVSLLCKAKDITEALNIFLQYIKENNFDDYSIEISIKDIKELKDKVKYFICEG